MGCWLCGPSLRIFFKGSFTLKVKVTELETQGEPVSAGSLPKKLINSQGWSQLKQKLGAGLPRVRQCASNWAIPSAAFPVTLAGCLEVKQSALKPALWCVWCGMLVSDQWHLDPLSHASLKKVEADCLKYLFKGIFEEFWQDAIWNVVRDQ